MPVPITTNVVPIGYSQARCRQRVAITPTMVTAHHNAHPTCKLGIAATSLISDCLPAEATVPKMWCLTRVSVMAGTTNRGGATGTA